MYTLISGSPKPIDSNSMYFLKKISSSLDNYKIFNLKKKIDDKQKMLWYIDDSSLLEV